jgi:hypothetical protein
MSELNNMKVPFYSYGNINDDSDFEMAKTLISS